MASYIKHCLIFLLIAHIAFAMEKGKADYAPWQFDDETQTFHIKLTLPSWMAAFDLGTQFAFALSQTKFDLRRRQEPHFLSNITSVFTYSLHPHYDQWWKALENSEPRPGKPSFNNIASVYSNLYAAHMQSELEDLSIHKKNIHEQLILIEHYLHEEVEKTNFRKFRILFGDGRTVALLNKIFDAFLPTQQDRPSAIDDQVRRTLRDLVGKFNERDDEISSSVLGRKQDDDFRYFMSMLPSYLKPIMASDLNSISWVVATNHDASTARGSGVPTPIVNATTKPQTEGQKKISKNAKRRALRQTPMTAETTAKASKKKHRKRKKGADSSPMHEASLQPADQARAPASTADDEVGRASVPSHDVIDDKPSHEERKHKRHSFAKAFLNFNFRHKSRAKRATKSQAPNAPLLNDEERTSSCDIDHEDTHHKPKRGVLARTQSLCVERTSWFHEKSLVDELMPNDVCQQDDEELEDVIPAVVVTTEDSQNSDERNYRDVVGDAPFTVVKKHGSLKKAMSTRDLKREWHDEDHADDKGERASGKRRSRHLDRQAILKNLLKVSPRDERNVRKKLNALSKRHDLSDLTLNYWRNKRGKHDAKKVNDGSGTKFSFNVQDDGYLLELIRVILAARPDEANGVTWSWAMDSMRNMAHDSRVEIDVANFETLISSMPRNGISKDLRVQLERVNYFTSKMVTYGSTEKYYRGYRLVVGWSDDGMPVIVSFYPAGDSVMR